MNFLYCNIFYIKILMQAPQSPIDIKITLGSEVGVQNLVNLDFDLSDDKDAVTLLINIGKKLFSPKKNNRRFWKRLRLNV